jgi:hypothetical protein
MNTSRFLEAREYAAVLFQLIEEAFDQMTLLVGMPVHGSWRPPVRAGWNHRIDAPGRQTLDDRIGVMAFIADHRFSRMIRQQGFGLGHVRHLPFGQNEVQRISQGIGYRVNLGAEAAPRTSQRLVFRRAAGSTGCARWCDRSTGAGGLDRFRSTTGVSWTSRHASSSSGNVIGAAPEIDPSVDGGLSHGDLDAGDLGAVAVSPLSDFMLTLSACRARGSMPRPRPYQTVSVGLDRVGCPDQNPLSRINTASTVS